MTALTARLALVEDNPDLRDDLHFHLERAGHHVVPLADGKALDAHLAVAPCDLVLLDLGLPGEDGLSIASRLRQARPELGIVMLTARGLLQHRLEGLESGADAYLVKPVELQELKAVLGTVLRRIRLAATPQPGWSLHTSTLTLVSPAGERTVLTSTEFALLQAMAHKAPEAVERRTLIEQVFGEDYLGFDPRRLEAALSRLRRKLQPDGDAESPIRSVRNIGYLFAAPIRLCA